MINTQVEIRQEILTSVKAVTDWLEAHPDEKFEQGPIGKWNTSQHLDHLMQVDKTVNSALQLPKAVIRGQFGEPNRAGRTYEEVVNRYQEKLKTISSNVAIPGGTSHSANKKAELVAKFSQRGEELAKAVDGWTEEELDSYLIPHPLLGRMIVREFLFWLVYHHYHHLNNLKSNY